MDINAPLKLVHTIAQKICDNGGTAYLVGGCVRDKLLGRENKDIDIEVHNITADVLETTLSEFGEVMKFGASFGVYNIKGYDIDFALPRTERKTGEKHTDFEVTVYSFEKLITLLVNCNPNTIELLGLKPEHYLYADKAGKQLLDNKEMFLSQRAAHSFGGYANQQLRRLENGSARSQNQHLREQHLLKVINGVTDNFKGKFAEYPENAVSMYIDKSERFGEEIYVDFDFKHYPLRDFNMILEETSAIEREYSKLGMRNSKAIEHGKIEKHAMHLVRLYYMAFDILENKKIVTYREKEHNLLMSIRNGAFNSKQNLFSDEFYEMVDGLEKRLEYAEKNTDLPKEPDYKRIEDFVVSVNSEILKERG